MSLPILFQKLFKYTGGYVLLDSVLSGAVATNGALPAGTSGYSH